MLWESRKRDTDPSFGKKLNWVLVDKQELFIGSANVYLSATIFSVLGTVDIVTNKAGETIYKDINKGAN